MFDLQLPDVEIPYVSTLPAFDLGPDEPAPLLGGGDTSRPPIPFDITKMCRPPDGEEVPWGEGREPGPGLGVDLSQLDEVAPMIGPAIDAVTNPFADLF